MRNLLIACCLLPFVSFLYAQPPVTDIYVLDLKKEDGQYKLENPVNITQRKGYDNQPHFTEDNQSVYYTSIDKDDQADIYRYIFKTGKSIRITETSKTSEYSATVLSDKKHFSVVRVEEDGATQRLWKFPITGGQPTLISKKIKDIGYHCWIDDNTLALFILGNPDHTLHIADLTTQKTKQYAENIGRCMQNVPGEQAVAFVHKTKKEGWWIKKLNLDTEEITPIVKLPEGQEDFCYTQDGTILLCNETKVLAYQPKSDKDWQEITNLSSTGEAAFYRISISKDNQKVAVVSLPKGAKL